MSESNDKVSELDSGERIPRELLEGELIIARNYVLLPDAVAFVVLEDCSRIDAPAEEVAQCRICDIEHDGRSTTKVPFLLTIENLDPHSNYYVRVHISQAGSSEIRIGDYVSTESYPVFSEGHKRRLSVGVRAVS